MAKIPQRVKNQLHDLPGVKIVGEGMKNGQPRVVVFVSEFSPAILDNIPEHVTSQDGRTFPVVVKQERGGLTPDWGVSEAITSAGAKSVTRGRGLSFQAVNDSRQRPLVLGTSIAPQPSGDFDPTGTLGWFMTDGNETFMVSNNHVFTGVGRFRPPRPIMQPGNDDGGSFPDDRVGELVDFVPFNSEEHPDGGDGSSVDVAWATIDNSIDFSPEIIGVGEYSSNPIEAQEGDEVEASGRTSGHQTSEVLATDGQANICIPNVGEVRFFDLLITDNWSDGGDSGSPVVTNPDNSPARPTGLHFAGGEDVSAEIKIQNILDQTGLSIVANKDGGQQPPPGQASFTVSPPDVSVDGQVASVTYTVENTGDAEGTKTVSVQADVGKDGSFDEVRTVDHTLGAGQSETNTVQITFDFNQRRDVQFCTE